MLLAWPVAAQVKLGELSTHLSGTIAPGYTADYGNMTASDHTWAVGGAATLSGFFYNPNFLSFDVGFYLNQSRANSDFQSISNASGINASGNIFGGSRFPGSINYSKAFDSEGSYDVPGVENYVTHGNSDTFGINWSENLPDAPSFSAGFQMGSSQYSVYGSNDLGNNSFHSLNLHSGYTVAGFNMGAYYSLGGGHSLIPAVVTGQEESESYSGNSAYGFNVSHRLPLKGSISAGINRSNWSSDYLGSNSSGTIDTMTFLAGLHPAAKLSLSASANYSDNLSGQLIQSIVAAGGVVPGINTDESSDSLDLLGVASYTPMANLQTSVYMERRTQEFLGVNYAVDSYGGGLTYAHTLLKGNFNAALNVTDNTSNQNSANALGFSTTENYSNEILGWNVTGSFGYAQNVQTLLVTYMNSFYNYSGNMRRRWGMFNVSAGAGASRTALTQQAGTANSSQSYNASVGYGQWLTGTGSYSKASGQALATGAGLVPVPVPVSALPSSLVSLYGGDSYSFGLSSMPVKKFILTASYAKSTSNTSSNGVASLNENDQYNALIQYQYRKLSFNSGYSRLGQGFSASGTPPQIISSYYFGVSRWFNFF
ncbi:MAG: hypothetical protein ABR976_10455 [Terracidiphilus sp.]